MELKPKVIMWLKEIGVVKSSYNNDVSGKVPLTVVNELFKGKDEMMLVIKNLVDAYNMFYHLNFSYKKLDTLLCKEVTDGDIKVKVQNWKYIGDYLLNFGLSYSESQLQAIANGDVKLLETVITQIFTLTNDIIGKSTQCIGITSDNNTITTTQNNAQQQQPLSHVVSNNNNNNNNISAISDISYTSTSSQAINIHAIDTTKTYIECETPLEFFIVSLSKNIQINSKQAVALLANNRKYLTVLCFKGIKGSYTQIINWYEDIYINISSLISLANQYKDNKGMIYATIGVGLYSKSIEIISFTYAILKKLSEGIGLDMEWFYKEGVDLFMYVISKHTLKQTELIETFISFTYGHEEYIFNTIFKDKYYKDKDNKQTVIDFYINILTSSFTDAIAGLSHIACQFEKLFYNSIIDIILNETANNAVVAVTDNKDEYVNINLLNQLWFFNARYSRNNTYDQSIKNKILSYYKTLFRKNSNNDNQHISLICSYIIINMFLLLKQFAKHRIDGGPLIYKTLVFLFLENYNNIHTRELFLVNFSDFFITNPSAPLTILLEPYIKQLNNINTYSICDYNFLFSIINHPKYTCECAKGTCEFIIKNDNNKTYTRLNNTLLNLVLSLKLLQHKQDVYYYMNDVFVEYVHKLIVKYMECNFSDNSLLENVYDIMLYNYCNVNEEIYTAIVSAVEEYRKLNGCNKNALLALLWFYNEHDDVLLRLEETYSTEQMIISCKNNIKKDKANNITTTTNTVNANNAKGTNSKNENDLRQSVELLLKKIKNDKEVRSLKKKEEIKKKKIKEQKIKNTLHKELAKKSLSLGIDQSHFSSVPSLLDITCNSLIQDEGSIINNNSKLHNTHLHRPTSKMKLNTLLSFNQYNFIVKLHEEEPAEQQAIEAYNKKYKTQIKYLCKAISIDNGQITKASILKYLRSKNLSNNDITLDELSLCIRNCFGINLNELEQNQFKTLLTFLGYFILSKQNPCYTISECYYKFLQIIIPNLISNEKALIEKTHSKYKKVVSYLREHIIKGSLDLINIPPGIKIINKIDVIHKQKVPSLMKRNFTESYIICIEVLNDIIYDILGYGFLEKYTKVKKYEDVDIDIGSTRGWSNDIMIAYAKLSHDKAKIGVDVGDCLEEMLRKLCKGKDKMGNIILSNVEKEKLENNRKLNEVRSKKEEMRLRRRNQIKEKVEMFKKEKEEMKKKEIEEKEKNELKAKIDSHNVLIETKKKNKKVLDEIKELKKKKEEIQKQKENEIKEKEKQNEQKAKEEKNKFFKEQKTKLKEQFEQLKKQKENIYRQKIEKSPSHQKLPAIPKHNTKDKDKAYIEFDKNLITIITNIFKDNEDISFLFSKYEEHLKLIYDKYNKIYKNKLEFNNNDNNNCMYLNEFKEFLVDFLVLNVLVSTDQMNFAFKRIARKNDSKGDNLFITFDDFKIAILFMIVYAKMQSKLTKIEQHDIDVITKENVQLMFDYLDLKCPFDRRDVEGVINERRGMSVKEFFALQQERKRERVGIFKNKDISQVNTRAKSRPHSKIGIKKSNKDNNNSHIIQNMQRVNTELKRDRSVNVIKKKKEINEEQNNNNNSVVNEDNKDNKSGDVNVNVNVNVSKSKEKDDSVKDNENNNNNVVKTIINNSNNNVIPLPHKEKNKENNSDVEIIYDNETTNNEVTVNNNEHTMINSNNDDNTNTNNNKTITLTEQDKVQIYDNKEIVNNSNLTNKIFTSKPKKKKNSSNYVLKERKSNSRSNSQQKEKQMTQMKILDSNGKEETWNIEEDNA